MLMPGLACFSLGTLWLRLCAILVLGVVVTAGDVTYRFWNPTNITLLDDLVSECHVGIGVYALRSELASKSIVRNSTLVPEARLL